MDVIFDIDGTLANAEHRLHLIKDTRYWVSREGKPPTPDWDTFLADDQVAGDSPIPQTWAILESMLEFPGMFQVIFITGRPERSREMTHTWLTTGNCEVRGMACAIWRRQSEYQGKFQGPILYMRKDHDHRPSHVVKRDLLKQARFDGFNPTLVFEDRVEDTKMWREAGLLCCQVAEGNY